MGGNGGGSMNPAGIMTGMAMGGALGQQMVQQGQLTPQTYVWKQGMAGWELEMCIRDRF